MLIDASYAGRHFPERHLLYAFEERVNMQKKSGLTDADRHRI